MIKFSLKITSIFLLFVFFFLAPVSILFSKEPLSVYLTWQRNPESTMTIYWITPVDESSDELEYKLKGDSKWQTAKGTHSPMPDKYPYWIHGIELNQLRSDSDYTFRIASHKTKYKFHTMSTDPSKPIRFIDGGDVYHDDISFVEKMNKQAAKLNPMFAIVGGDIAYNDESRSTDPENMPRWMDFLIAWKKHMVTKDGRLIPIIPAIGNHDVKKKYAHARPAPENAPFFYSLFAFPGHQGYNVLDFGQVMSLWILDSDHTHYVKGDQTSWLAQTLKQRQNIPHKFASYHVGAFPSYRKFKGDTNSRIRKYWVPLLNSSV